jgi:hypothetical protein
VFPLDADAPLSLDGFYGLERNDAGAYRWTKPQATLTLPINRPASYQLTLTLQDSVAMAQPRAVTIRVDDTVRTVQLDRDLRDYTFMVSVSPGAWVAGQESIFVQFEAPAFSPVDDPRPLGVLLGRVILTPVKPPLPAEAIFFLPLLALPPAMYWMMRGLGVPVIGAVGVIAAILVAAGLFALVERAAALRLAYLPGLHPLSYLALLQLPFVMPLAARASASPDATDTARSAASSATWQRMVIVGLLLLICYGSFHQASGWNEYSRYDLVRALVADRSTRIDPYAANTGDKATYRGHTYSDKAPGAAFLAVPAYVALRGVTILRGEGEPTPAQALPLLTLAGAGLPTIVAALLLLHVLHPLVGGGWALAVSVGYGLGTLAWPFATLYFGHAAAACFLFATFVILRDVRLRGRPWLAVLAGFLAGWSVLVEFPAALGVAVLLAYAYWRGRRPLLLMLIGAIPPALLLCWYNWASFGSPFALGYAHLDDGQFAAGMGQGLLGVTLPKATALVTVLLDARGLLRLSPWLIFAPFGLWAARRPALRAEVVVCGAICLAFVAYNVGYYLPLGGWTPGPRFLVPALPFLAFLVALAPPRLRPLIALEIGVGIALCGLATITMPNANEALRDPLRELWWPRLLAGDLALSTAQLRWGLAGLVPLAILVLAGALALVALYTAGRPRPAARRLTWLLIALLLALVLGFGLPIDVGVGATASGQGVRAFGEGA